MLNVTVRVVSNKLPAAAAKIRAAGPALVQKTAQNIAKGAQSRAPVDTGALRASIQAQGGGMRATVSAGVLYAIFVEFGTSRMGAQPFFIPSVEAERPAWNAAWRALLGQLA